MKKADWIIIGTVIVIVGILCLFLYGPNAHTGDYVQIEIDGQISEVCSLSEDAEKIIDTENGSNTLVIQDGKVFISDADCPDKICVHHQPISRNGESIICLPHRVVVTVVKSSGDEIDAEV